VDISSPIHGVPKKIKYLQITSEERVIIVKNTKTQQKNSNEGSHPIEFLKWDGVMCGTSFER
jgi:hypothetical protein